MHACSGVVLYISRLVASVHSQLLAFATVVPSPHERLSGRGMVWAPVDSVGVGGVAWEPAAGRRLGLAGAGLTGGPAQIANCWRCLGTLTAQGEGAERRAGARHIKL